MKRLSALARLEERESSPRVDLLASIHWGLNMGEKTTARLVQDTNQNETCGGVYMAFRHAL